MNVRRTLTVAAAVLVITAIVLTWRQTDLVALLRRLHGQ
jgi:hypothetical protein